MQDVSPHALIKSFISGLSDFMSTLVPAADREQSQVFMWRATGAVTYRADRDCIITGVYAQGHATVNTIGQAYGSESQGYKTAGIILITKSGNPSFVPMRFRLRAGDVITYDSDVAGTSVHLFIEY